MIKLSGKHEIVGNILEHTIQCCIRDIDNEYSSVPLAVVCSWYIRNIFFEESDCYHLDESMQENALSLIVMNDH